MTIYNVKTHGGALGNGVTDDTAAFQSAIDAVALAGGGNIFVPYGTYIINGAFSTIAGTDGSFSTPGILKLPARNVSTSEPIAINIFGEIPPAPLIDYTVGTQPVPARGSIIKITRNDAAQAYYSLFANGQPTGGAWGMNNVMLRLGNLIVRSFDNPNFSPLNLNNCSGVDIENVLIDTGTPYGSITYPTNLCFGLVLPQSSNQVKVRAVNVDVAGYAWGIQFAEHAHIDDATMFHCGSGLRYGGGDYHNAILGKIMPVECTNGIDVAGPGRVIVECFGTEHKTTGPWAIAYDINDPSNQMTGQVTFGAVTGGGVGMTGATLINGAANLNIRHIDSRTVESLLATNHNIATNGWEDSGLSIDIPAGGDWIIYAAPCVYMGADGTTWIRLFNVTDNAVVGAESTPSRSTEAKFEMMSALNTVPSKQSACKPFGVRFNNAKTIKLQVKSSMFAGPSGTILGANDTADSGSVTSLLARPA